jgi:hypothetical protein
MVTPAVAKVEDSENDALVLRNGKLVRWLVSLALALALNFGGWLYGYARLTERVDTLQYEVRELRTVLLTYIHNGK